MMKSKAFFFLHGSLLGVINCGHKKEAKCDIEGRTSI